MRFYTVPLDAMHRCIPSDACTIMVLSFKSCNEAVSISINKKFTGKSQFQLRLQQRRDLRDRTMVQTSLVYPT